MTRLPPPDVAAAAALVERWVKDGEDAAARAANPQPSAAERFDEIRTAQAAAAAEGRTLAVPPAPAQSDPARVATLAERWGAWRDPRQG